MLFLQGISAISFAQNTASQEIVEFSGSNHFKHEVQQGQTLYAISRLYHVEVDQIKFSTESNDVIRPGDFLYIPIRMDLLPEGQNEDMPFENVDLQSQSDSQGLESVPEDTSSVDINATVYSENKELHPNDHTHEKSATEHSEEHSHTSPIFFIILAIVIGAATRHFLKKIPIPYTALLLLFGIALGALAKLNFLDHWGGLDISIMENGISWAANIDPHILLYVFLPILIFEAAFAMDLHTFKKTSTNSTLLAVPGILMSLVMTAGLIIGLNYLGVGFEAWDWRLALLFGAVISATDPVAVVALLKELGASKKLGTLIEGESLLNDGTAIVLFSVFLSQIEGGEGTNGIVEFFKVSFGGISVGIVIGWVVLKWLRDVVNDAMVEIGVVIAAAYLTFYVAEGFFGVSGVLALVALGLIIGGVGRSAISPQVEHFMHDFWEMAGFVANTLIFIIVGVVIAYRSEFSMQDVKLLFIIYFGIHVIRAIMMVILYPFMRKAGYGLPIKDAIVVWYGALRGAIGLALALIVVGSDNIAPIVKEEFLFIVAGVVTLTLLVNATTIKYLVDKLGLTKLSPARQVMISNASAYLRKSLSNQMNRIGEDRYMKKANWNQVEAYFPDVYELDKDELEMAQIENIAETRRRLLEQEKSSYWHQFHDGLIGPSSVQKLSDGISKILDANGMIPLSDRDDLEESWQAPKWIEKCATFPVIRLWANKELLLRLTDSYDSAVGFIHAQDECLKLLESIGRGGELSEDERVRLEDEINENKIHGQSFIRTLRREHKEIYQAISTRQAIRSLLNYERRTIERLQKKGQVDEKEAAKMIHSLESRMEELMQNPPEAEFKKQVKKKPWSEG